jgi:hypothetical protein
MKSCLAADVSGIHVMYLTLLQNIYGGIKVKLSHYAMQTPMERGNVSPTHA